jgi:uncharacterized protein DUF1223
MLSASTLLLACQSRCAAAAGLTPEKVEPEKVEPEKVEPEKVEPEKVEPEKVEPKKVELAAATQATDDAAARSSAVVELFTSEGCSSCPAADETWPRSPLTRKHGRRVFTLELHVDYWKRPRLG